MPGVFARAAFAAAVSGAALYFLSPLNAALIVVGQVGEFIVCSGSLKILHSEDGTETTVTIASNFGHSRAFGPYKGPIPRALCSAVGVLAAISVVAIMLLMISGPLIAISGLA